MNYVYTALIIAGIVISLIVSHISKNKALEYRLRESFGKPPKKTNYDLRSIETYRGYKTDNSDTDRFIDDITWNDLDMDDIFRHINVCLTSIGEEYLYNCLHEPQFEQSEESDKSEKSRLEIRESFIKCLQENEEDRRKIQMCLARLGKLNFNGIPALIYGSGEKMLKFPFIYDILSVIPFICAASMFVNIYAGIMCLVVSFAVNTAVYLITKRKIAASIPTIQYFSSLIACCGKLSKAENLRSEPFMIQLQQLFQIFKPLMRKGSYIYQKTADGFEALYEYGKILRLSDIRSYNKVFSGVAKHREQFHELYKTIGEIDVSVCVLSFRESLPFWSNPVFHVENSINFKKIYHPLLSSPVPNSGIIKNNSIITGSNASGKSTFIKTLAVNGILAQTIFTCTAEAYSARFALVMTSMALRDNISEGDSYFIAEIKSLKRIIDRIQSVYCVCYIDEILRGTNTVERIAASASVLNYLNGKDCLCVAASHDIELAQMLQNRLDNYHFREQITEDGMLFDYKIKQGISNTRNAIKLLRYMNFNSAIIENAEALADKL